jgi:hypothetical protein
MGSIGCPETSVKNYRYPLCNNNEEGSSRHVFDKNNTTSGVRTGKLTEKLGTSNLNSEFIFRLRYPKILKSLVVSSCHLEGLNREKIGHQIRPRRKKKNFVSVHLLKS